MVSGRLSRLEALTSVAEQPLHRALGLTDGELDRIRELLVATRTTSSSPSSRCWSAHWRVQAFRAAPSPTALERPQSAAGAGEKRGRTRPGRRPRASPSSVRATTIPRRRALPGSSDGNRRDPARCRRHGRAPDRAAGRSVLRRCPVSRSGAPSPDRAYGNSVGIPNVGGETVFSAAYADNCLVTPCASVSCHRLG